MVFQAQPYHACVFRGDVLQVDTFSNELMAQGVGQGFLQTL